MQLYKVAVIMMVGLGTTWAARAVTDAWLGPPAINSQLVQAAGATGTEVSADAERKALEEELRRARSQLSGKAGAGELEEFEATRPLAADVAIALPSDM